MALSRDDVAWEGNADDLHNSLEDEEYQMAHRWVRIVPHQGWLLAESSKGHLSVGPTSWLCREAICYRA